MSDTDDSLVVLRDGEDASGMATMMAGLLSDNLRDYPSRARVAALTRGSLVLTATDRDRSVTLTFGSHGVEVADGALPGAPAMAGPWLEMSQVCSGRVSPVRALADRDLTLNWGRPLRVVPAGGFVLSVPAAYYGDTQAVRNRRILTAGVIVTLVVIVLLARRAARRTPPTGP